MAGVLKLIERQRASWDIRGRVEGSDSRPGRYFENGVGYGPCLLLSRECGSGGLEVARLAAEQLGWEFYDREIVDQVAQLANARQHLVESVDEVVRTRWESAWRPMIDVGDLSSEAYFYYLRQVVLTLGHHGDVVIVGRGAQFILPVKSALRVRLVAPLEKRIQRTADLRKINLKEAEAHVRQYDKDRAYFVRKHFHSDPDSPLTYDLLINTGEVPHKAAAGIVIEALRQKLGISLPVAK